MRIAIDARWIFKELSGIGVYTRELIRNLARIDGVNEYVLFFGDEAVMQKTAAELELNRAANFSPQLVRCGLFSVKSQIFLPSVLRACRIDVYHSTNYMIPFLAFPPSARRRCACVVTVHDVIPVLQREYTPRSRKNRLYPLYKAALRAAVAVADAVVTVSDASRADIIRCLRIVPGRQDRVKRIYCGVSERFQPAEVKVASGRPVILYVGRSDPYKNLANVVRAFQLVRDEYRVPALLKIVGSPDRRYPEPRELAERLELGRDVVWTGYLDHDELMREYRRAGVLVNPSRYEGFGLQVAEAMACGLPVVCTAAGGQAEVAGDAALIVGPDDVEALARRVAEVLTDPRLAQELAAKGIERAKRFSWRGTAEAMLQVYKEVHEARQARTC